MQLLCKRKTRPVAVAAFCIGFALALVVARGLLSSSGDDSAFLDSRLGTIQRELLTLQHRSVQQLSDKQAELDRASADLAKAEAAARKQDKELGEAKAALAAVVAERDELAKTSGQTASAVAQSEQLHRDLEAARKANDALRQELAQCTQDSSRSPMANTGAGSTDSRPTRRPSDPADRAPAPKAAPEQDGVQGHPLVSGAVGNDGRETPSSSAEPMPIDDSPAFAERARVRQGGPALDLLSDPRLPGAEDARLVTTTTEVPKPYHNVGCYRDDEQERDLETQAAEGDEGMADRMTVDLCYALCVDVAHFRTNATLLVFGLQYGKECRCGFNDDWGRYGAAVPQECDRICKGDPRQNCGGEFRTTMFQLNVP